MIKRLVSRCAAALVDIGRPIVARLEADPRLAESAGSMRTTQDALEVRVDSLNAAWAAEQATRARRDEDHRVLAAAVREFGFIVLSGNGNHHNADPYLLYFPQGYGDAMQLGPGELGTFVQEILSKLAFEKDEKILARREPIEGALNRFQASEDAFQAARNARLQVFSLVQAEKRNWVRGVVKARALAEAECHYERAYVRSLFAAITTPRRVAADEPGTEEVPAAVVAPPQTSPTPLPVTEAAA
jgi:hypothetical protein